MIVFVAVSAAEIVVIDLIVHRWSWVRIPLLVLGIWGLVWMIGALCAYYMRPHTVGSEGIRVRGSIDMDAHVTWDDVYSVGLRTRNFEPKTPTVVDGSQGRALVMDVTDQTNIEIVLERPTKVTLPGLPPKGGEQVIDRIYLWTDEPKGFLDAVREHIGSEVNSVTTKKAQARAAQDEERRRR
ncbi:MAG TPA: hypothetical protein PKE40_03415 [Arachnia sp.]|nr:hypothetical protein [Arachnia sp.]HMT85379.1 hypothetical protein [Arachnia sp.]